MGGRGTFAAGNPVPYVYKTVDKIEGVKVLEGINGKHSLPESSHSSTAYIKLDHHGVFKEMRFYDKNHVLFLETTLKGDWRSDAIKLPGGMKKKLRKYFKGVKI